MARATADTADQSARLAPAGQEGASKINATLTGSPTCTVPDVAEALGVSEWAVYEAIKRGTFPVPVLRVGRRIVIPTVPLRRALGMEDG